MATDDIVETIQDTFLSCSICFQPYNRPKALPCLHTFCEGCLRDYVASRFEGAGHFPCPLCRQDIQLHRGGVADFPNNHFIVGLTDAVLPYAVQETCLVENAPLLGAAKHDGQSAGRSQETTNKLIRRFGNYGTQPHEFLQISGVAVSIVTDDVILSDCSLNKIATFSKTGEFRGSFQCDCSIRDLAITRSGTLLVTVSQAGNAIMREFTTDGRLLGSFGTFYRHENPFGIAITRRDQPIIMGLRQSCAFVFTQMRNPSTRFGSRGRGACHFTLPHYVTTNSRDRLVISDTGNHRIKIHNLDGTFLSQIGAEGSKIGELFYPMGVCVDKYDNVIVADANNYRVQAFSPDGHSIAFPVTKTYEYGIDVKPTNVIMAGNNVLLVVLRGAKFCQVHSYFWDVERYRPPRKSLFTDVFTCCAGAAYDQV